MNVITNGYDVDDFKNQVAGKKSAHTKMHFVYTGTLFPGSRDISAIFQAVKELVTEGKMDAQKICFSYAGQHKNEFLRQYNNSGLDAEMKAYDVIPKSEAVAMQQSADLLMISAWNTKEYQGSLPLKVYEYLYTGQPILCCICGTAVNSELKQIILNCSAGTCYEEAGGQENFDVFKGKILEYYKEFFEKGYLESQNKSGQSDTIKRFNYKNITKQFADLIIIEYERANHGK